MSKAEFFAELVNLVDADPFALLGVSVSADEKRIAKRYRQIAKQLHPDAVSGLLVAHNLEPVTAAQVIARIVNPSYQKLKSEKNRQELLTTIRFRVRHLARIEKLVPTFASAQQLAQVADEEVDIFYEQALSQLAEGQFQSLDGLHAGSLEIGQLNLIFLCRKIEAPVIRPKRAGLMTTAVTPTAAVSIQTGLADSDTKAVMTSASLEDETDKSDAVNYAQMHTVRAKKYLSQQNYELALQELREAIKIEPQSPELHSMIGQIYYKQKLSGMAKSHFRQALKLKPSHQVAQKYGKILGISLEESIPCSGNSIGRHSPSESSENIPKKPWLERLLNR
ncbi:MAG: tetratricopeptide repeat protein [Phormidesmis sp.]